MPHTKSTRVVLVDDHTMFRQGLRQSLAENDIAVVGEASNGRAGVQLVLELRPDVVVMDLHMPQMNGIEAVRALVAEACEAPILMLTISEEEDDVIDALTSGASGYVLKTAPVEDVVSAVLSARDGDSVISPSVARRVVERIRDTGERPAALHVAPDVLTAREQQILRLIAEGKENAQIAEVLFISPSTAKNHVAHVLEKLGLDNRVQAAVYAVRAGLV